MLTRNQEAGGQNLNIPPSLHNAPSKSLNERIFEQQSSFSKAVMAVKDVMHDAQSTPEMAKAALDQFTFPDTQRRLFNAGIEKFYNRQKIVRETKKTYQEAFGESGSQKMFQDLFNCSGAFGKVEIYPDGNNLIFVCDDVLDVSQVINPEQDLFSLAKANPDVPLDEVRKDAQGKMPMGIFLAQGKNLPKVGTIDGLIVINGAAAAERGIKIERVIAHEQQHAENSLYYRPAVEKLNEQKNAILQIANFFEIIEAELKIKAGEKEKLPPNAAMKDYLSGVTDRFGKLLDSLLVGTQKTVMDAVVKEELLAFQLSGEKNEDIKDLFILYVIQIKNVFIKALGILDKLFLKYASPELAKDMGVDLASAQIRNTLGGMRSITGKIGETRPHADGDDFLNEIRNKYAEKISTLEKSWGEQFNAGLNLLAELGKYKVTDPDFYNLLVPLLISQPIERWRHIYKQALRQKK